MKLAHPLPVFLYHRINESGGKGSTALSVFRLHLDMLAERGWKSLRLDEFEAIVSGKQPCPRRSFLITFDDGCDDLPVVANELATRGFTGASFLVTGWLDGRHGRIDSEGVRTIMTDGVMEFGCHSDGHLDFSKVSVLPHESGHQDLKQSRVRLIGLTGSTPASRHLAWPWGRSTPAARRFANDLGFDIQFTVASRPILETGSCETLWPRICVENLTPVKFSILLQVLSLRLPAAAMSALNQWKRRGKN
jgi:peptidoglycan/xylan/chitin deacetylase (PgdA/CDA1 family)